MTSPTAILIARHYGLDWLRIGAFALLILFHIGLYFAPGHWIVKSPVAIGWVAWPLAAIVPWRLTLLFAISGYATAAMLQRYPALAPFLADRSKRLLIPLLFGACVVVPPQDWVRSEVEGIHQSYLPYLLREHFTFHVQAGTFLPSWEHLWFLAYLLVYTALLVLLIASYPRWREQARPWLAWLTAGHRLLWLPPAAILVAALPLNRLGLTALGDSMDYLPAFLIGFGYAHLEEIRAAFARVGWSAAVGSALSLLTIWAVMVTAPEGAGGIEALVDVAANTVMSWAMLPVAFHFGGRFLAFDHPWRRPLARAVFPAYVVHQTIIVVVGWYLGEFGIAGMPAFVALFAAVLIGCWLAWRLATANPIAGMLLGVHDNPGGLVTPPRTVPPVAR